MVDTTTTITIAGHVHQGERLYPSTERVTVPTSVIEKQEQVYCVADASLREFDVIEGDLLIVEPKTHAETGELVLAQFDDRVFVGRWWAKHGRRDLLGADSQTIIVRGATVIGSINLIVRPQ
jgi:SOS-response transcriptional repressor LexA